MGETITLKANDGHSFGAYRADPEGKPRGAIVVIQEIFGVNHHIRDVTDRYAALGYVAIAPAVFDRAEKNFEAGYDQPSMEKGRAARGKISTEALLLDTQAAIDAVKSAGKVGIVGYCMGGSVAFLAATRLDGLSRRGRLLRRADRRRRRGEAEASPRCCISATRISRSR